VGRVNKNKRYYWIFFVITVIAFSALASVNATDGYRRVDLLIDKGVSIELPNNWIILSNRERSDLQAFVNSKKDSASPDHAILDSPFFAVFKRNSLIVGIAQAFNNDINATQNYLRKLTKQDIAEMNTALKKGIVDDAAIAKSHVLSWEGTNKETINGVTALVSRYRLKDESGAVKNTCLINVLNGERSFALNVIYLEGEQQYLEPATYKIINSLKLSGISDATVDNLHVYTKPTSGNANKFLMPFGVLLVLSLLYTWGIGLTPPLLIRFLIARKPIGKWWAIGTAVGFFFINIIVFTILNEALSHSVEGLDTYRSRSHGGLILIAAVSYLILRKKLKHKSQSGKSPKKKKGRYGWIWILLGLLSIYLIGMLVVLGDTKSLADIYSLLEWKKIEGTVGLVVILGVVSGFIFWVRFLFSKYIFIDNKEKLVKTKIRGLKDEISDLHDEVLGRQNKALDVWNKIKKKNQIKTMEKNWATLAKGDTHVKVAGIVGKPNFVENEGGNSTQEKWTYDCGSGGKRSITFKDGFMVKIEVTY
jgi:hypothetical protein